MARAPSGKEAGARGDRDGGAPGLFLLFAPGTRPVAADLTAMASGITIGDRPSGPNEAMELVLAEQRFVLLGLAPGPPIRTPPFAQAFDFILTAVARAEAIRLAPVAGRGGDVTRQEIRQLIALGIGLAQMAGVVGLGWEAAGTVLSPDYFRRVGRAWLEGGAFPGLGLTALLPAQPKGPGLHSTGLALFTGFELAVRANAATTPTEAAKLAVRAMHALVDAGCEPAGLAEWLGEPGLLWAWSNDGQTLSIERT